MDSKSLESRTDGLKFNSEFAEKAANPAVSPQGLGLGKKEFDRLMDAQIAWSEADPATRAIISPVEHQQSNNAEIQAALGKTDQEMAELKRRQSEWKTRVEAGTGGLSFSDKEPYLSASIVSGKPLPDLGPAPGTPPGQDGNGVLNEKLRQAMDEVKINPAFRPIQ